MSHDLKIWPKWFGAVENGSMPFQIRRADRDYTVGDTLRLREWDEAMQKYTGREVTRTVTFVFAPTDRAGAEWPLHHAFCVLGLGPAS